MRVRLETWAKEQYAPGEAPSLFTLRKWARNGEFWPPASKDGKHYYVEDTARRLSHSQAGAGLDLVHRLRQA